MGRRYMIHVEFVHGDSLRGIDAKERYIKELCLLDIETGKKVIRKREDVIDDLVNNRYTLENLTLREGSLCCVGGRLYGYALYSKSKGILLDSISDTGGMCKLIRCIDGSVIWMSTDNLINNLYREEIVGLNFNIKRGELKTKKLYVISGNEEINKLMNKYNLAGYGDFVEKFGDQIGFKVKDSSKVENKSVVVPRGVSMILSGAFRGCRVEEIVLSEDIREIHEYAFERCTIGRLVIKVSKGKRINAIGEIFRQCKIGNVRIISDNDWDYDIDFNLKGGLRKIVDIDNLHQNRIYYNIDDNIKLRFHKVPRVIERDAIRGVYIKKVDLRGSNLRKGRSFTNCILEEVIIEGGLVDKPFANCKIRKLVIDLKNSSESKVDLGVCNSIEELYIFGCKSVLGLSLSEENKIDKLYIGDDVEKVGRHAFECCNLFDVVLGKNIKILGDGCFWNNKLEKVIVSKDLEIVDHEVFDNGVKIIRK